MLFQSKPKEQNEINYEALNELEHKSKFGFLEELNKYVRTDEEYAKYKGYIN